MSAKKVNWKLVVDNSQPRALRDVVEDRMRKDACVSCEIFDLDAMGDIELKQLPKTSSPQGHAEAVQDQDQAASNASEEDIPDLSWLFDEEKCSAASPASLPANEGEQEQDGKTKKTSRIGNLFRRFARLFRCASGKSDDSESEN